VKQGVNVYQCQCLMSPIRKLMIEACKVRSESGEYMRWRCIFKLNQPHLSSPITHPRADLGAASAAQNASFSDQASDKECCSQYFHSRVWNAFKLEVLSGSEADLFSLLKQRTRKEGQSMDPYHQHLLLVQYTSKFITISTR
jgi:hypothetical protein